MQTREEYLQQAIATHPQLWEAMENAWKLQRDRPHDPWAQGQLMGFMRALGIVGELDLCIIEDKLAEDFA